MVRDIFSLHSRIFNRKEVNPSECLIVKMGSAAIMASCLLHHLPHPISGPQQISTSWYPLLNICQVPWSALFCLFSIFWLSHNCFQRYLGVGISLKYFSVRIQKEELYLEYLLLSFHPYPAFSTLVILEIYLTSFPLWQT